MWVTLEQANRYFRDSRINSESWFSEPYSREIISQKSYTQGIYLTASDNPHFDVNLNLSTFLYYSTLPFKISSIRSANQLTLDTSEFIFEQTSFPGIPLYTISESEYSSLVESNKLKQKTLIQCEMILKNSGLFIIPSVIDDKLIYGLLEFAFSKFTGYSNQAQSDIANGITKKKIDVLEWEYDNNKSDVYSKYGIPPEAMLYLNNYANPNYNDSSVVGNTVFSF